MEDDEAFARRLAKEMEEEERRRVLEDEQYALKLQQQEDGWQGKENEESVIRAPTSMPFAPLDSSSERLTYSTSENQRNNSEWDINSSSLRSSAKQVNCPVCSQKFSSQVIFEHVEDCLVNQIMQEENSSFPRNSSNYSSTNNVSQDHSSDSKDHLTELDDFEEMDGIPCKPFECPICMNDVEPGEGYRFHTCKHSYCGVCLYDYYTTSIMNGHVEDMKCPTPNCPTPVSLHDLNMILDSKMMEKYQLFLKKAKLRKNPNIRYCPNPQCGAAVERKSKSGSSQDSSSSSNGILMNLSKISPGVKTVSNSSNTSSTKDSSDLLMECETCHTQFCFDCQQEFHPGKTCSQSANSWFPSDFRATMWKKLFTKPCPACDAAIVKSSGCNHMTCSNCGYEFCWLCSELYTSDHFAESGCRRYGSNYNMLVLGKRLFRIPRLIASQLIGNDNED